jgi:alkanesulfonate monooxygenase SsuD/methylene tetrahydromethanopterin reductase-like flavin-dependent oxidoreductase (luciferase family)
MEAERLGFDSIWFYDHFHTIPKVTTQSCFECWTTLAALAPVTSKIRLGQIVTCNSYRHPAVLAKMASVLDVISGGRVEFGIGAGWYDHEYNAYGIPFEKASIRIAKLEEAVRIIKKMWTEESANFEGKYYQIRGAINSPKPLEYYKNKLDVLRKHCVSVGRNFREIEKTILTDLVIRRTTAEAEEFVKRMDNNGLLRGKYLGNGKYDPISPEEYKRANVVGNPEECLEKLRSYRKIGVEHFIFDFPMAEQLEAMKILAEQVMPKVT